jgi:hypothetical protein
MGTIRVLPAVTAPNTTGWRTPVFTGTVLAAASFSILKGIATIVLTPTLPTNGYNGPNGYPTQNGTTGSKFDIYGGINGSNGGGPAGGQQVTLWGFTTGTYFNGCTVTVLDNNPSTNSFRFYFANADVASTSDAGNTAAAPVESYRAVRIEVDPANSTDIVYVGDLKVTPTQYMTALTPAGPNSIVLASDNIRADRIFICASGSADTVHVTLIY